MLIHVPTRVAMWTRASPVLPEWGFKQQEINGHKNLHDPTNLWFADEIIRDTGMHDVRISTICLLAHVAFACTEKPDALHPVPEKPKTVKHLNFFRKFFELQILMIQHNAGLTDSHPYASGPINWPFLLSGISFWTSPGSEREQIYMIGNVVDWWFCVLAMSVFVGILGAEQIARRRGIQAVPERECAHRCLLSRSLNNRLAL